jgi:hypothetical protein
VYLSDFGLTKQHASESGITETGQFMGTADYVSPEQIEHQEVSGRTDECVLYECLTGQAPFRGESLMGVLWGHMNRDATPASEARPELPSEIDAVLARAMAKEPERRYATCGELAREAATALGLSAEIVASGGVRASSTRRWVVSVALLLLVVAAAVVALMLVIGGVEAKVRCRWRKTRSFDWTGLGRSLGLRGWDGRRRLSSKTTFSGSFSVMGPSGSRARKTTRSRR